MKGIPNIVIPTIRSVEFMKTFLDNWKDEFKGCHVIIVEDRKKKILTKLLKSYDFSSTIYDWRDIDKDLGKDAWIIPRGTDCVRSYGYYKAWQNEPNMIVTLDDDVRPQERHIETFYKKLYLDGYCKDNTYNTLKEPFFPRGTEFGTVGCSVAHGGWGNVPDFSAREQIKNSKVVTRNDFNEGLIPKGAYFSMCGMNLAWQPHVTKDMYFGLQGKNYPIDRKGDIWCGHHLTEQGYIIHTGEPFCIHTRASNVWSNLKKEQGIGDKEYYKKLDKAREIWEGLFK